MGSSYENLTLLRGNNRSSHNGAIFGAVLVIGSLLNLLLPLLFQLSLQTLLSLGAFVGGALLISIECFDHLKHMKRIMQRQLNVKAKTLVLDDVLRDVFSMSDGLMGCILGTIGLYSLPIFTKDQRRRLIQATSPPEMNMQTLLFSPGGISDFLPHHIRRLLFQDGDPNILDEKINLPLSTNGSEDVNIVENGTSYDENDLSWDPTEDSTVSLNSYHIDRGGREVEYMHEDISYSHDRSCVTDTRIQEMEPAHEVQRVLLEQISKVLRQINSAEVGFIGVCAALTCAFQIKRHPSLRRHAVNVLHGAIFGTAFCTTFGAFGILSLKGVVSKCVKRRERGSIVPTSNNLNTISVMIGAMIKRIRTDIRFRKRWQVFISFAILAILGRHRRKKLFLMKSSS